MPRPAQLRLFTTAEPSSPAPLDPAERDRFLPAALTAWFDRAARDLPWRRDRAPYAVWISEIMLQQTRVDTVIPYFQRFLAAYPDVRALAAAPIDDVLHLWSGLGYYRRARQLHATAREITAHYDGVFPAEAEALRALPGIGAYTAGAISSIAYGKREPLVDGNVSRVLARVEGIDDNLKLPKTQQRIWDVARRLLPAARPGHFNEALMELGATVCTPREPRCGACPLARACVARASGRERELPVIEAKRKAPVVRAVAAVIIGAKGAILFARRREGGLFGGLWEPPMIEGVDDVEDARAPLAALGIRLGRAKLREVGRVSHVLTHRRMEITVAIADAPRLAPPAELGEPYEKAAWLDAGKPGVGVSTLARKVIGASGRLGSSSQKEQKD